MTGIITTEVLVSAGAAGAPVLVALVSVYQNLTNKMGDFKKQQDQDRERTWTSLHALDRKVDTLSTSIKYSDRTMKSVETSLTHLADSIAELAKSQHTTHIILTGLDGKNGLRGQVLNIQNDLREIGDRVRNVEKEQPGSQ